MGRSKKEMKGVHARKIKKAKEKLQLYLKKEVALEKLSQRVKHFLLKSNKKKTNSV